MAHPGVIPHVAKRKCGTQKHRSLRHAPRVWVPDKPYGLSGMTVKHGPTRGGGKRWLGLALAFTLTACAQPPLAKAPVSAASGIAVRTQPVALNANDAAQVSVGAFTFAGGLELTSRDTSRLHGLSDVRVSPAGRLTSVSDDGDFFRSSLVLDAQNRLIGLKDSTLTPLTGPDGQALQGKQESDAEGLAILANGDLLISLERHDRILLYPAKGGPARSAPGPLNVPFPDNSGMEALSENLAAGPDAYMVGGEASGQTWACTLSKGCTPGRILTKPDEFGLVALVPLPQDRLAYVIRAWDPLAGSRVVLIIDDANGREIDRLNLVKPLTVDNLEGVAAVPAKDGSVRFYLISDDNFSPAQRTLLLAFDWKPHEPH